MYHVRSIWIQAARRFYQLYFWKHDLVLFENTFQYSHKVKHEDLNNKTNLYSINVEIS